MFLPIIFESLDRQAHQFGTGRYIPVGVGYVNMSEIGRQDWQAAFYVLTGPVPLDQSFHGEPVSKIMQPRPMTVSGATQPDLAGQSIKGAPDLCAIQSSTTTGYEEGRRPSSQDTIPPRSVV